jgi:uncharacterized metal-binding protein
MSDLPKKKVGIVACSGEELAEGTVSRLAALQVLERLRPSSTVTICLPLFLAGGEGDRAFARFYPTIAIDGCELKCAARGTAKYSGKPAAEVVVRDLVTEHGLEKPEGGRRLNEGGQRAVEVTASRVAGLVDELLGKSWSRTSGVEAQGELPPEEPVEVTCSCGSGVPVTKLQIDGQTVELIALRPILEQFRTAGRVADQTLAGELLAAVKIYNFVSQGAEESYRTVLLGEYARLCEQKES